MPVTSLVLGLVLSFASPSVGQNENAVEKEGAQNSNQNRPEPVSLGRRGKDGVRTNIIGQVNPVTARERARKRAEARRAAAAQKANANKNKAAPAKPAAPPKAEAPAAGAANPGDDSPWSKVDLPDEMATGIEFKRPRAGVRFSFNLVDADLMELIKIIGNITGRSFILGSKTPRVKATIYAPTKITAAEAYQAFLSVLQINGLTVEPAGRYLKILPLGGDTSKNMRILKRENIPPGDEIVTRMQRLEHVSAEELANLLGKFKSAQGDITVYAPTNMLIITDYGSSIRRLLKLIRVLDSPETGEKIWIEPINHADATEMATRVTEIFDVTNVGKTTAAPARKGKRGKKSKAPAPPVIVGQEAAEIKISKIIPDERTNSLIIVASENAYVRILELIKRLDVPVAGEGTLHMLKLQHADADELSKTLSSLTKGAGARATKGKKGAAPATSAELFEGAVQISADKATNSLVVVSTLRDYMSLKSLVDKLDVMKQQVFVEAVIMEVSQQKDRNVGVGFHVGKNVDTGGEDSLVYGSSQPGSASSLALDASMLTGLAAGIRGPEIPGSDELIGFSLPAFGVALQALQTNSDANVLSTPHILASDNEEAVITVGENVPIQQGYNPGTALLASAAMSQASSLTSGLTGGIGSMGGLGFGYSIGRQNVGLTLKIVPHINDDEQVRLEIDLEVSEIQGADPTLGPNISKKNAKTTSVVSDQQTIVIGGLITDSDVETTKKVPVLGDIPILGALFRSKSTIVRKKNLLIFLTPYIVRTSEDFREIFNRKMAERREFIERWTAFEYHRVDPHLDWSRTSGVVSEINRVISEKEENEKLRRDAERITDVIHTPKDPIYLSKKDDEEFEDGEEKTESDGAGQGGEARGEGSTNSRVVSLESEPRPMKEVAGDDEDEEEPAP